MRGWSSDSSLMCHCVTRNEFPVPHRMQNVFSDNCLNRNTTWWHPRTRKKLHLLFNLKHTYCMSAVPSAWLPKLGFIVIVSSLLANAVPSTKSPLDSTMGFVPLSQSLTEFLESVDIDAVHPAAIPPGGSLTRSSTDTQYPALGASVHGRDVVKFLARRAGVRSNWDDAPMHRNDDEHRQGLLFTQPPQSRHVNEKKGTARLPADGTVSPDDSMRVPFPDAVPRVINVPWRGATAGAPFRTIAVNVTAPLLTAILVQLGTSCNPCPPMFSSLTQALRDLAGTVPSAFETETLSSSWWGGGRRHNDALPLHLLLNPRIQLLLTTNISAAQAILGQTSNLDARRPHLRFAIGRQTITLKFQVPISDANAGLNIESEGSGTADFPFHHDTVVNFIPFSQTGIIPLDPLFRGSVARFADAAGVFAEPNPWVVAAQRLVSYRRRLMSLPSSPVVQSPSDGERIAVVETSDAEQIVDFVKQLLEPWEHVLPDVSALDGSAKRTDATPMEQGSFHLRRFAQRSARIEADAISLSATYKALRQRLLLTGLGLHRRPHRERSHFSENDNATLSALCPLGRLSTVTVVVDPTHAQTGKRSDSAGRAAAPLVTSLGPFFRLTLSRADEFITSSAVRSAAERSALLLATRLLNGSGVTSFVRMPVTLHAEDFEPAHSTEISKQECAAITSWLASGMNSLEAAESAPSGQPPNVPLHHTVSMSNELASYGLCVFTVSLAMDACGEVRDADEGSDSGGSSVEAKRPHTYFTATVVAPIPIRELLTLSPSRGGKLSDPTVAMHATAACGSPSASSREDPSAMEHLSLAQWRASIARSAASQLPYPVVAPGVVGVTMRYTSMLRSLQALEGAAADCVPSQAAMSIGNILRFGDWANQTARTPLVCLVLPFGYGMPSHIAHALRQLDDAYQQYTHDPDIQRLVAESASRRVGGNVGGPPRLKFALCDALSDVGTDMTRVAFDRRVAQEQLRQRQATRSPSCRPDASGHECQAHPDESNTRAAHRPHSQYDAVTKVADVPVIGVWDPYRSFTALDDASWSVTEPLIQPSEAAGAEAQSDKGGTGEALEGNRRAPSITSRIMDLVKAYHRGTLRQTAGKSQTPMTHDDRHRYGEAAKRASQPRRSNGADGQGAQDDAAIIMGEKDAIESVVEAVVPAQEEGGEGRCSGAQTPSTEGATLTASANDSTANITVERNSSRSQFPSAGWPKNHEGVEVPPESTESISARKRKVTSCPELRNARRLRHITADIFLDVVMNKLHDLVIMSYHGRKPCQEWQVEMKLMIDLTVYFHGRSTVDIVAIDADENDVPPLYQPQSAATIFFSAAGGINKMSSETYALENDFPTLRRFIRSRLRTIPAPPFKELSEL